MQNYIHRHSLYVVFMTDTVSDHGYTFFSSNNSCPIVDYIFIESSLASQVEYCHIHHPLNHDLHGSKHRNIRNYVEVFNLELPLICDNQGVSDLHTEIMQGEITFQNDTTKRLQRAYGIF